MSDKPHVPTEEKLAAMIKESLSLARMIGEQNKEKPAENESIRELAINRSARQILDQLNEMEGSK